MKILITGGHGQLAYDCARILQKKYDVVSFGSKELDITDTVQVRDRLRSFAPDILLNCAAFTKVDNCETERNVAWKVNSFGPGNLAVAMNERGGLLIHISTDYVFDGQKNQPAGYIEDDIPGPLSCYGISKLAGEKAVQKKISRHLILRTAWLFGMNGHNFIKTMLRLAITQPEKTIQVVNDQFGSFTWTYRLAQQIEKLIEAETSGIYHATAEGCTTWYEGARYFLKQMNVPNRISPCTTDQYPTPAQRPKNSILENQRLKQQSICVMDSWQKNIEGFVSAHREDLLREVCG